MKKTALLFNIFLVFGLLLVNTKAVFAGPHQEFSPSTGNYTVGQDFSVIVKMNSGGMVVPGADGRGTYDATKLDLINIKKSSSLVFDEPNAPGVCDINDFGSGKFSYSCYSSLDSNNESGEMVIFSFRAKAVGTALVKFECVEGATSDTNIFDKEANEILVCSENVNGSYIISAGSGEATDTTTDTSTEDTESDELPKTGVVGATLGLILFGAVSVISAVFLKFL